MMALMTCWLARLTMIAWVQLLAGFTFTTDRKMDYHKPPDVVLDHPLLQLNASFGSSLHRIDLDGDFRPELLVGADRDDTTGNRSRRHLDFPRGSPISVTAQQRR